MLLKKNNRKGFTITEIIIATAVFVVLFSAIMWMSTSSRAESSKSINYLRALELAQEGGCVQIPVIMVGIVPEHNNLRDQRNAAFF